jgi:predicted DNA-binding transcriptional regulator AlpA
MTIQPDPYWTLDEVAAYFGVHPDHFRRKLLPGFQAEGFPLPLPYSRRQRRWSPEAVREWKRRYEVRKGAGALRPAA